MVIETRAASGARRRMKPDERRAQLLRCALAEFARRGIRRAAHADVAKLAGVAVSTVFLYFPTREALRDAVLDEVERFYLDLAGQVHASGAPAPEVLSEHGRRFRASIESHPDHAYILLNWGANVRSSVWPRYLAFVGQMVAVHQATIERGIREGNVAASVDPEAAARILIGYANMSAQLKLANFDAERTDFFAATIVSSILRGPAAPGEEPERIAS